MDELVEILNMSIEIKYLIMGAVASALFTAGIGGLLEFFIERKRKK